MVTLRRWVSAAVAGERSQAVIGLRFVGAREGRALNRRWRGVDKATNVLAFPVEGLEAVAPEQLGDVVLCAPVVQREAREQGKTPRAHYAHLVVHGVLHLMGYDHINRRDQAQMEAREILVLSRLGFTDPYEPVGS